MNLKPWLNRLGFSGRSNPEAALEALFEAEFTRRGLPIPPRVEDGRYEIDKDDGNYLISIENLVREFSQDRDPQRVSRYVDNILESLLPLPTWPSARSGLRFSAEPSFHEFDDTFRLAIGDGLCRVLAWINDEGSRILWLTPALIEDWGASEAELNACAAENMSALLRQTPIQIEMIDQFRLGMLLTNSPFKASLIFSPNLKEIASAKLAWPLYAVIPSRDFAYVFDDPDLIERLDKVVVQEYTESAYPISTEVYRIDDDGIEAIGEFPLPE